MTHHLDARTRASHEHTSLPLTDLQRYREEGYLELGERLSQADVTRVTQRFNELDAAREVAASWEPQYDETTGQRRLRKLRRLLWNEPELFASVLCRAGIPDIAEAVIGPRAVAIFHAAFLKPARIGTHVGLHQDQALWSREYRGAFSVWMALSPVGPQNGGLAGRPFSHLKELAHTEDPQHPWHPTLHEVEDQLAPEHRFVLEPGDAVMWDRRFAHSSGANHSDDDRRGMVVVFADGSDPVFDATDAMSIAEIRSHASGARA